MKVHPVLVQGQNGHFQMINMLVVNLDDQINII